MDELVPYIQLQVSLLKNLQIDFLNLMLRKIPNIAFSSLARLVCFGACSIVNNRYHLTFVFFYLLIDLSDDCPGKLNELYA